MRQTRLERRIMWGWVGMAGNVRGGNCAFIATRVSLGSYAVTVTEPTGLPVPNTVHINTLATNATGVTTELTNIPGQRGFGIGIRANGAVTDNDFYWTAIGS